MESYETFKELSDFDRSCNQCNQTFRDAADNKSTIMPLTLVVLGIAICITIQG